MLNDEDFETRLPHLFFRLLSQNLYLEETYEARR